LRVEAMGLVYQKAGRHTIQWEPIEPKDVLREANN